MSDDTQGGAQPPGEPPFWKRTKVRVISAIGAATLAIIGALATLLTQETVKKVVGEPTGIDISVEQGSDCNAKGWVYPHSPDSELMNAPPGTGKRIKGKTWDQDPDAFGAVPAGPVKLHMVVTAKAVRRAVVLHSLTFTVKEKKRAIQGTHVAATQGCGNGATYHYGVADFDKDPPYLVERPKPPKGVRTDDLKFPYTVTSDDPSILLVSVWPSGHSKWEAELEWQDGKTKGTTVINDHGQPFETTDARKVRSFGWENGKRVESR